jgi:hypothetical protein
VAEQGLNLAAQFVIATAGAGQKGNSLGRHLLQGRVINLFGLPPAFRAHRAYRRPSIAGGVIAPPRAERVLFSFTVQRSRPRTCLRPWLANAQFHSDSSRSCGGAAQMLWLSRE